MTTFDTYTTNVHPFTPTRWNGRPRNRPLKPFFVFHTTESNSALNTIAYFGRVKRYAGYHTLVDDDDIFHIMHPGEMRAYHATNGGNDGIGISMATRAHKFASGELGLAAFKFMKQAATAVLEIETELGITVPRVHPEVWDRDANVSGFYGHVDLDPGRRSDPGWDDADWTMFFQILGKLENPEPEPVPEPEPSIEVLSELERESLRSEFDSAVAAGLTDGSRPNEPATRAEVAVMAYRAATLNK